MKKYYIVYKITNLINNKIYIGVHKTSNINDNYMGSGLLIRRAIKKYGIENFKKDILHTFDNEKDMYKAESKLVNEDFLKNNVYNLTFGGLGSWNHVNKIISSDSRVQWGRKGGISTSKSKKYKNWLAISYDRRVENARKMGLKYGGRPLSQKEINNRLDLIKDIDLNKFGWVKKVSKILNISHTETRRFIIKCNKKCYKRKSIK
jgi:hypothetical protein